MKLESAMLTPDEICTQPFYVWGYTYNVIEIIWQMGPFRVCMRRIFRSSASNVAYNSASSSLVSLFHWICRMIF